MSVPFAIPTGTPVPVSRDTLAVLHRLSFLVVTPQRGVALFRMEETLICHSHRDYSASILCAEGSCVFSGKAVSSLKREIATAEKRRLAIPTGTPVPVSRDTLAV